MTAGEEVAALAEEVERRLPPAPDPMRILARLIAREIRGSLDAEPATVAAPARKGLSCGEGGEGR